MSFGNKKAVKRATAAMQEGASQAAAATQPANFYSPYGGLTFTSGNAQFHPGASGLSEQIGLADYKLKDLMYKVPTSLTVKDLYDNEFYEPTRRLLRRPIDEQYGIDREALNNELNARNQMGSSYDALRRYYMDKEYSGLRRDADDQARQVSANAYQQQISNYYDAIAGLGQRRAGALQEYYYPATFATSYQQALSPLQTARANAFNSLYSGIGNAQLQRKPGFQGFMDYALRGAQTAAQVAGVFL